MHNVRAIVLSFCVLAVAANSQTPGRNSGRRQFTGASALELTRKIVAFGPRPAGSEAHAKMERFIAGELQRYGCKVEEDAWPAQTPLGGKRMKNILVTVPGKTDRIIAITGHYDTKLMPGRNFVGANDGGSSAGFLLEMARVFCGRPRTGNSLVMAWLDGEEATRLEWTDADSLYGSKRLALRWAGDGTAKRVQAVINVDMIGDADLQLVQESFSNAALRSLIFQTMNELGLSRHIGPQGGINDDHTPFLEAGMRAIDLIDFSYGPNNSYWHTDADTVDKLSANSFDAIGKILLRVLEKLDGTN